MTKETQNDKLAKHLKEHGSITALDAFRLYGIYRCSARIYNLRESGYQIDTERIAIVNRYGKKIHTARYIFISEPGAAV